MVAAATDRAGIASVPQARVSGDALPGIWIGGQIVRLGPLDRHHRSAQGAREHFVDMGHGEDLKPQQHIFGYFGQVLFIRSEEHTSELHSLMRNSSAVSCLKTKTNTTKTPPNS